MEFWGVEVKSGESLKVDPGKDKLVHLSKACLGEVNKHKGSEPVSLYVKFGNQKLVLGTLSSEKFPQISHDLVFEKEFELSHNWKNGSVFFTGYKAQLESASADFDDEGDIPVDAANGKPEFEVKNSVKPDANEAKQKEKTGDPRKNEKANEKDANGEDEVDSSESESDEDSSEDEPKANGEVESSEGEDDSDDEDDDESDDEETPKKTEASNKRVVESSKRTPVPEKKVKLVTPQKTDGKNGGHVATPHPSKQAGKAAAANSRQPVKQQTPKSGGDYSCQPCNRSFKTEDALNSHNRAKHSATR